MQLNINDLKNVVTLIDVAASRGLFSGADLATVAAMRERFATAVAEMEAPAEEADKPADE